jgi:probable rRNA maturation factor
MHLTVINQSGRPVPRKFLATWVKRMEREAARQISPKRFRGRELVIVFVDAKEQRRLNKTYRGKNYATDVLSFESMDPVGDSAGDLGTLGELVICPEVISRQAKEHGLLVREELGYMVLHGFLHLLGYDHEKSEREAKRMFQLQDEMFERLLGR